MGLLIFGTGGGGGTGTDLSADTVTPQQVRNPYTFHDAGGNAQTGEIYNWDGTLLSGGSSDVNKMTVAASTNTRHLKAGCYLARDIELTAMPAGSATMSRSNNMITLTKTAGYISAGTDTETIPTYGGGTVTPGKSSQTVSLVGKYNTGDLTVNGDSNLVAGNIKSGVSIFGVAGSYTGQSYPSYTGSTSVTPGASKQTLYTGGTVVGSNIVIYGDSNLKSANIRSGYSIFGVQGSYSGGSSGSVYFGGSSSMTLSGQTTTISGSSTLEMVSLIGSSTNTNAIVAVTAWRDSTTCYFYVNNSDGRGTGTASWSNNSVTLNLTNSHSWYFTGSYRVVYAYFA